MQVWLDKLTDRCVNKWMDE